MERQLLKKLLSYDFYVENKKYILKEFFEGEFRLVYETIAQAHDKYTEDLTPEWVGQLFKTYYPASTAAGKINVANLLDDIAQEDEPPDELAADILKDLFEKEIARKIAEVAVEVINGNKKLADLNIACVDIDKSIEDVTNYDTIDFNLEDFLDVTSSKNLFAFRHPELQRYVGGAGRGNFVIIFARPEAGKTAFAVYNTAGYLTQGLRVAYFANEEPARRVYLRLVSSMLERSEAIIREDVEDAKKCFSQYTDNLNMIDCVGMDIKDVDVWVGANTPDVIVLDQIDKFRVDGKFNRDDERLGKLYEYAREIAKRNNCLVIGISQASADGDGHTRLDFSMLAGSKTSKAAEADLIIGIGYNKQVEEENSYRMLHISKNKINGFHGSINTLLDKHNVIFKV
jgi:replicative DNA helicase